MLGHVSLQKFFLSTGTAFAPAVPVLLVSRLLRYYAAIRLPCPRRLHVSGLPSTRLPWTRCLFCVPPGSRHDTGRWCIGHQRRVGGWSPVLRCPDYSRGKQGPPDLLGSPLRARPGRSPRQSPFGSPTRLRGCCLPPTQRLGHWNNAHFGAGMPQLARSSTYASPALLPGQRQSSTTGLSATR